MINEHFIVEFFSLPGSGKTTISYLLIDKLYKAGIKSENLSIKIAEKPRMNRLFHKVFHVLNLFIQRPIFFVEKSVLIVKTRPKTYVDLLKVLINYFYIVSILKDAKKKKDFIILDQGILQAIWSINITAKRKIEISKLLPLELVPNIVIALKVGINNINERLTQRINKGYNVPNFKPENPTVLLNEFQDVYNQMLEDYNYKNIITLQNNFSYEVEENIKKIVMELNHNKFKKKEPQINAVSN